MNCKFCGNFLPDGSDSCQVCGRRQDEQPIGKLLSENMPNPVAAEEAREEAAKNRRAAAAAPAEKSRSVAGPIILLLLAVAGWLFGLSQGVMDNFRGLFSGGESGAHLVSGSDFVEGSGGFADGLSSLSPLATTVAILTVIGLVALVTLLRRLGNKEE